ncbi:MAG: adenosine deaminase [Actinomycetota bacterium]
MRDLSSLPKTDLHVHFQGSVRVSTLRELAEKRGTALPPGLDGDRYAWKDFFDFLTQYGMVTRAIEEPDYIRRVAVEICEDEAADGVRYAEVTLSVVGQTFRTGDWFGPVAAALDGFEEGFDRFGTRCRLVLDHPRGFPVAYAEQLLDVAVAYRDRGVVALGLAGPEAQSGADLGPVFRRAIDHGIHSVPHAGEAMGPESIREAIDILGAERIGHGFRIIEDADLVAEVARRAIPLEVCPTSNVVLGNVGSYEEHPLPRLIDAGLVVTLNSDDPAMFSSPVTGEYEAARRVFGLDDHRLADLARAGVRASYADDAMKQTLQREIDRWLEEDP